MAIRLISGTLVKIDITGTFVRWNKGWLTFMSSFHQALVLWGMGDGGGPPSQTNNPTFSNVRTSTNPISEIRNPGHAYKTQASFHLSISCITFSFMFEKPIPPLPVFNIRLRSLRRARGIKQFSLAEMLGVNQTSVSRWEAGIQTPSSDTQFQALSILSNSRADDYALRRLVESSCDCVHLVDEATHICLAYSKRRAMEWKQSQRAMLGISLWQFATEEIQQAEHELADTDWWHTQIPASKYFTTSEKIFDEIVVSSGGVLWERLYLSDGTPVRLCTLA